MSNVQPYLQHLVGTIGPRPASSDTERVAAEWIHATMQSHGLTSDIQDFESVRSHAVADAFAYLALVAVTVLVGLAGPLWFAWVLWVLLALLAVGCFLTARGRQPYSILMPKGPSQNVVARYAPHSQRGEKRRKVVVVAHYDTAVPTLLESSATAAVYSLLVRYARFLTYALPVIALVYVLPFEVLDAAERWVWYVTLVLSVLPLTLGLNALSSLVMKRFSPGANANGSGVAAMLAVVDELVGEAKNAASPGETSRIPRTTTSFSAIQGVGGQMSSFADEDLFAGAAPASASAELPDDFAWAPAPGAGSAGGVDDLDLAPLTSTPVAPDQSADAPSLRGSRDAKTTSFATVEFAAIPEESQQTISFAPTPSSVTPFGATPGEDVLGPDVISLGEQAPVIQPMDFGDRSRRRSIFDFLRREPRDGGASPVSPFGPRASKKAKASAPESGSGGWLGVPSDFDATSAGEEIGSWDNFSSDDTHGWKGGWAEGDLIEDSNYAEEEAARIRRRVAESATISLDDKEVWFIATGAGAEHNAGMRALLAVYGAELRGAVIINVESVGEGQLFWLATEGAHADVRATSRLVSIAKRASKDTGILAKAAKVSGLTTDATVALRSKMKAFTVTRLVDGQRPATAATTEDVLSTVDELLIAETATYVSELVRQS